MIDENLKCLAMNIHLEVVKLIEKACVYLDLDHGISEYKKLSDLIFESSNYVAHLRDFLHSDISAEKSD